MSMPSSENIGHIINYFSFLEEVIHKRIRWFFQKEKQESCRFTPLKIEVDGSPINRFIAGHNIRIEELIILLLALVPHVKPNLLDAIVQKCLTEGGEFPEIGGVRDHNNRCLLPTGETALFILCGINLGARMQAAQFFSADHFFAKEGILALETLTDGQPRMSGKIILQQEYVDLFTVGSVSKPTFGPDFPARNITTKMDWNDLILNPKTEQQIQDIKIWLDHNESFLKDWEMGKRVKPGYRALFYGPPGTGKTLTATLLGKQFQKDVYRIDLSQVVSKYIGETEKNLEKVFTKAEHKDWILFFDEADALFGKRANVQNAHDKYANQEVSYLLQRVEDFPGLIILASNYKTNIDTAFTRRFNAIIHFPIPTAKERYKIWECSVPAKATLAEDVDLSTIANKYELSGSAISNVIHYASLQALSNKSSTIFKTDLLEGIKREYEKEDKVFVG